ncbi:MAG: hypothetical protein RMK31_03095 [Candidatus Caldarchaeum sp.]|nr:hypothetical protein [Candidatus Caldarchaeum sp.]MDW7977898.1 hypothetical protein [Candidatus Caldarchaeum sp.]MDW8359556.1 hypothetical protein [Candidatus Caldarchaeum sp.]
MPLAATVFLRKKKHLTGKTYFYIHIPSKISSDSQFIFREGEKLRMAVYPGKGRIVLTRVGKGRKRKYR